MHIYFSGIGGTGVGPLAEIAHQAGYTVSGSDKQESQYLDYLRKHGITNIHVGQDYESIARVNDHEPIDWLVYSSAVAIENPDAPELKFCRQQDIRISKRDELLNQILKDQKLKLLAVAGTHGKTTTTAMLVWAFKALGEPVSYILPAKTKFADMGHYDKHSKYFVYECDEFDRNFLAFEPFASLITGVSWDHHEIFPTRENYQDAFREFLAQSRHSFIWQDDYEYLEPVRAHNLNVIDPAKIEGLSLKGHTNRLDAWLVIETLHNITGQPISRLLEIMNHFPGLQRRMEEIVPGLYSDYAHTPEKIRGAIGVASEIAAEKHQDLIVVYEPLTNRRQAYMLNDYKDSFDGAKRVYWLPSYLAREDPNQPIVTPNDLIAHLSDPAIAEAQERNDFLEKLIRDHLDNGDMVVCIAGGGGDSLDEWVRARFAK